MESITNKFTSLLKPQSHRERHARARHGELPIYQQLPDVSVGSTSPSLPRSSSSTERPLPPRATTATSRGHQSRPRANTHGFSSSSETLASLDVADTMASVPPSPSSSYFKFSMKLPTMQHFLSDFTLGFADGLTVPFALTAGLSSLGQTKTVIYAGMAEICAGSISMGIGGYLAARGENRSDDGDDESESDSDCTPDDDEAAQEEKVPLHKMGINDFESNLGGDSDRITSYLSPLNLPPYLKEQVLAHVRLLPSTSLDHLAAAASPTNDPQEEKDSQPPSAILSGFSISLGYLLGGILPLFPYFFVERVTDGLAWSFAVCVLALFLFGFGKAYALGGGGGSGTHDATSDSRSSRRSPAKWKRIKRSIWEGLQMVVLGSIAAGAAVVCVNVFEGFV